MNDKLRALIEEWRERADAMQQAGYDLSASAVDSAADDLERLLNQPLASVQADIGGSKGEQ